MTESIATRSIETNVLLQKAYPVSFRILNEKMEEKIYLEDQPSSGVFELSNDSGRALHFVPAHHAAIAGPDNYHFALKFRPGILKSDVKSLIKHKIIQKDWTLSIGLVSLETGEVVTLPPTNTGTPAQMAQQLEASTTVLYFLNTSKASLAPGEKILLPLKHLRLQADEGTQVTQVELSCKNLAKDPAYTQVLQPHIRHFNLTLINHRGSPIMPIHVGFTGFNAILNDGKSENQLTLRITNQQKRTPQNKGTFTFSHDKHSRMYLYFETDSEQSDYALGTVDQVAGIGLDIVLPRQKEDKDKNTSHLVHEPMFQGDTPIWEIYPEYGDIVLQPHQTTLSNASNPNLPDDSCLDIVLSKIITGYPSGTTNLYIRFENIPGFWDHTYSIPMVKQPLVFKTVEDEEFVGIGTADPTNKLEVNGDIRIKKTVDGEPSLIVQNTQSDGLGASTWITSEKDNSIIQTDKNLHFRTKNANNDYTTKMVLSRLGNLSIGNNNSPSDKLEIGQYDDILDNYLSIKTAGGERYKTGIRLKHFSDDVGWTIESDDRFITNKQELREDKREFRILRHTFDKNGAPEEETALRIKRINGFIGIGDINPDNRLSVKGDAYISGSVSIGGSETPKGHGVLEVKGSSNYSYQNLYFLGAEGAFKPKDQSMSIWGSCIYAEGNIVTNGTFNIMSDIRIKNIEGISDSKTDLETVRKIQIQDYKMKDVIAYGNQTFKKLVGQQIRKVFPQAVSVSTHEIPDIYQISKLDNGWVKLVTKLKVGQKVLLIFGIEKVLFEVLETRADSFRVNTDRDGEVFVYGRQVSDFMTVDYDSISMLNVSATQELAKQLDELKAEKQQLKTELSELKKGLSTIQEMLGMK